MRGRTAGSEAGVASHGGVGIAVRRILLRVAYDGTDFHGWQVQPGLPTVQGELERILTEIEGSAVAVHGSGRTDAGVHARGQMAAVTMGNPIPVDNLRRAVNRLLPETIRVLETREVALDFHPRFDARAKTYEYRIYREEVCPPFERRYVHHHPYPLDEGRMIEAARCFEGEHDFVSFASAQREMETTVRTIFESRMERRSNELVYRVRGSGFLMHMVRLIMGTLVEVGKGNLSREDIGEMLAGRRKAIMLLPARGLTLVSVEYDQAAPE